MVEQEPTTLSEKDIQSMATETGYSEAKQSKITEQAQDLHLLKRLSQRSATARPVLARQRQQGTPAKQASVQPQNTINQTHLESYRDVSSRLHDCLVQYISLLEADLHRAKTLLDEIDRLREEQHSLFQKIVNK
jgi:hypothetical protein